jgi:hypothetical protein
MLTQAKFFNATKESVECILNGTPIIGHAKAMAHYAMGNPESGNKAMKAATRSAGVIGGGSLGMMAGGPTMAITGAIIGGAYVDGITTQVESVISSEYRPNGLFYVYDRLKKGEATPAEKFDAVVGVMMDGAAGYSAGKAIEYKAQHKRASLGVNQVSEVPR